MKDIKIYKRPYSHELIKKTKKYNFYGSKELIQVIIVGENLQFFLTFRYSLK